MEHQTSQVATKRAKTRAAVAASPKHQSRRPKRPKRRKPRRRQLPPLQLKLTVKQNLLEIPLLELEANHLGAMHRFQRLEARHRVVHLAPARFRLGLLLSLLEQVQLRLVLPLLQEELMLEPLDLVLVLVLVQEELMAVLLMASTRSR